MSAFAALAAQAAGGPVRVIVGLAQRVAPEGQLTAAAAVAQRDAIGAAQDRVMAMVPQFADSVKRFESIPFMALELDAAALASLKASPMVATVQEDELVHPTLATSVPLIGAPTAWSSGYTGAGWSVAVLDTGVDKSHPFLDRQGRLRGLLFDLRLDDGQPVSGRRVLEHRAGVGRQLQPRLLGVRSRHARGRHRGGPILPGVARDASVIAIQVFSYRSGSVVAFMSDLIRAMERVMALRTTFNIAAVNMSLGGGGYTSQASCDAANGAAKAIIDQLRSVNIATVISSGNESLHQRDCRSRLHLVGGERRVDGQGPIR